MGYSLWIRRNCKKSCNELLILWINPRKMSGKNIKLNRSLLEFFMVAEEQFFFVLLLALADAIGQISYFWFIFGFRSYLRTCYYFYFLLLKQIYPFSNNEDARTLTELVPDCNTRSELLRSASHDFICLPLLVICVSWEGFKGWGSG